MKKAVRARSGWNAREVNEVFERQGDTRQRANWPSCSHGVVDIARRLKRPIRHHSNKAIQSLVVLSNTLQSGLCDIDRTDRARGNPGSDLLNRGVTLSVSAHRGTNRTAGNSL